ncbi:hypothetical protein [Microtetraspora sp. NBRC 16547]|uniref:hypothetical protein n=1 Tax=Microtetraspora sp. NBRC 16547 TaxID=3030993 RepID=UPI0024A1764F|nr:hypothetical protein [Microtetraspora sp. NBRC 16547]GLX02365.1 hypothetical protein Misp02_64510 [Microtetraspora sp. NBRC 16547]
MAAAAAASIAGILLATANSLHAEDGGTERISPTAGLAMKEYGRSVTTRPSPDTSSMPIGPFTGPHGQTELQTAIASGRLSLAEVFRRNDDLVKRTPVSRVLRALPGYSPDKVAALIMASEVQEGKQMADLTVQERRKLLKAFPSIH